MEACQQIIEPQLDAFRSAGALTPEVAWRTMAMVGTATSSQGSVTPMGAVTYFVRMVAKEGKAEEVQQLLLENPRRIEQGERGNLAFGVHRSIDYPNEFWLYETWVSEEAVEAHESGAAFRRYKEALRPLIDPDSVLFGNCVPVKVLGYSVEPPAAASAPPRES